MKFELDKKFKKYLDDINSRINEDGYEVVYPYIRKKPVRHNSD